MEYQESLKKSEYYREKYIEFKSKYEDCINPNEEDTLWTSAASDQIEPIEGTSLYGGISLLVYFLPGANKTDADGNNRLQMHLQRARSIWPFPILLESSPIDTNTDFGFPNNLDAIDYTSSSLRSAQERRSSELVLGRTVPSTVITVWYGVFSESDLAGLAISNNPGNRLGTTKVYQHIFIANETSMSTLAHEIGHILFGTVLGEKNTDPTSNDTSPHSPLPDNFMNPPSSNKTGITPSQVEKACKSFLFFGCIGGQ
ncbi:TPA: hypothetical protein QCW90_003321 [Bacillus mobilis]|nr:hypothetical protein [Bacillus mobilis]